MDQAISDAERERECPGGLGLCADNPGSSRAGHLRVSVASSTTWRLGIPGPVHRESIRVENCERKDQDLYSLHLDAGARHPDTTPRWTIRNMTTTRSTIPNNTIPRVCYSRTDMHESTIYRYTVPSHRHLSLELGITGHHRPQPSVVKRPRAGRGRRLLGEREPTSVVAVRSKAGLNRPGLGVMAEALRQCLLCLGLHRLSTVESAVVPRPRSLECTLGKLHGTMRQLLRARLRSLLRAVQQCRSTLHSAWHRGPLHSPDLCCGQFQL